MKKTLLTIFFSLFVIAGVSAQTPLAKAKTYYKADNFTAALPLFEDEYKKRPTDATVNQWLGACLYETKGDLKRAEELLLFASKRKIRDSFLYLGMLYTQQYKVEQAKEMFNSFEKHLRRIKADNEPRQKLEQCREELSKMRKYISSTEDIQFIDSVVVDKSEFLYAYSMSLSTGKLEPFNKVFSNNEEVNSTVYFNEKGSKIYYAAPNKKLNKYTLYSKEKLMDEYSKETQLSEDNFGLTGGTNYPFLMTDGVTIYFASQDEEGMGGYDLFVSRYNMNNDTYLNPERLNPPFNSIYNDYMMVIDEEKGVGWFASDRNQADGMVCVYTFIPNEMVNIIESEDMDYLASRAQIRSIKATWKEGKDYTSLIASARAKEEVKQQKEYDFTFVINDEYTYHSLEDFKDAEAMETYNRAWQMSKEFTSVSYRLDHERASYNEASDEEKVSLAPTIRELETQQETLRKDIKLAEKVARRQEIKAL